MADRSNHVTRWMVVGCLYFFTLVGSALGDRSRLRTCNVYSKPSREGVCGPRLDEALEFICGPGNFKGRSKRSVTSLSIKDTNIREMGVSQFLALSKQNAQMNEQEDKGDFGNVLIQRSAATNFLHKRIPFKMSGVSCECCYHSCSVDEMLGYCQDRSKAMIPF